MKIHEYQAKTLMSAYHIAVPKGGWLRPLKRPEPSLRRLEETALS